MTCIAGFVDKLTGTVYLGGDSAGSNSMFQLSIRKQPKVFKTGNFIFGYTSSFRMGQIIEYYFSEPDRPEGIDDFKYMVTRVVPHIKEIFEKHEYGQEKDGEKSGGTFLIGYRGHLYQIQNDYQVAENIVSFDAVGCAEDIALGALTVMDDLKDCSPENKITQALKAAELHSAGVRAPFHIVSLDLKKD